MSACFVLVDANSFYASCEKVFRPDLRNRPVVVLSNNDGCIIARSSEAKALGIQMGTPYFKIRQQLRQDNVAVFSSNYALYGDMSRRMMTLLREQFPAIEPYSIDEAFADATGVHDVAQRAQEIKQRIWQGLGLPVGVGISTTKTLAKLANHAAKQWPAYGGVVDLRDRQRQKRLLDLMPLAEVWGVGRRLVKQLNTYHIFTAGDLARCSPSWIRRHFSVVLERTVLELNGESCLSLEDIAQPKKQIIASRSFGRPVRDYQEMREAVCEYTAMAAEKLRFENQYCQMLGVSIRGYPHGKQPFYSNARHGFLQVASNDTRDLIALATKLLDCIWQENVNYQKAAILLGAFSQQRQGVLFRENGQMNDERLMKVIDGLNQKKRCTIQLASQGLEKPWKMQRAMLSPARTTNWRDILAVH